MKDSGALTPQGSWGPRGDNDRDTEKSSSQEDLFLCRNQSNTKKGQGRGGGGPHKGGEELEVSCTDSVGMGRAGHIG